MPAIAVIASLLTIVGRVSIGVKWQIVPTGILTGIMASVAASRVHDREAHAPAAVATNRVNHLE